MKIPVHRVPGRSCMTSPLRCDHGVRIGEQCDLCEDAQLSLVDVDALFETRPYPDPKQAMREAALRWTRGQFEIVTDPEGRVA